MKPTTEELKALLAKVTPGEYSINRISKTTIVNDAGRAVATTAVHTSNVDDGHHCDENESNAVILALAPTLAREVIELREAINDLLMYCVTEKGFPNKDRRTVEQQFAYDKARKLLS